MNFHRYDLELLEIDRSHVASALQSFVNLILINRALGPIRTRDVQCPDLDMQYVVIDDPSLVQFVDRKIDESVKSLTSFGSGSILLSFYERHLRRTLFLTTKEDKIVWEQWSLPVQIRDWIPKDLPAGVLQAYVHVRPMLKCDAEQLMRDRFLQILHLVNESQGQHHLPQVPGPGQPPLYPLDFDFIPCTTDEFWTPSLKRILRNGPPKFT